MEVYSTFQIKDHYYWVETPKAKAKPEPKPQPTKPACREHSIQIVEADGTIASYAAYQRSKPVVMPGSIWV